MHLLISSLPFSEEIDILNFIIKILTLFIFLTIIYSLFKALDYDWEDIFYKKTPSSIPEKQIDLQTYQNKEIETLKKKYDAMEEKPTLYFDPHSDKIFLCSKGT